MARGAGSQASNGQGRPRQPLIDRDPRSPNDAVGLPTAGAVGHGLEILRPRERRRPRVPNKVPPWLEERVIAFALGHPGLGPRRIAAQLALPM